MKEKKTNIIPAHMFYFKETKHIGVSSGFRFVVMLE